MTKALNVRARPFCLEHLAEIKAIEAESFDHPWTQTDFVNALQGVDGTFGRVAEHEDRAVGFIICQLRSSRILLLNLAVAGAWRRRGVGSRLVGDLVADLSESSRKRITAEVRETNLPAQLFFRAKGFRAISVLRNHYSKTREDCYLFEYRPCRRRFDVRNRIRRLLHPEP